MRYPLSYMYITNPYKQAGYGVFGVHAGLDLRAGVGTNLYAPGAGTITENYIGSSGIQVLSARINGKEHRFLHLSQRLLKVGAKFSEGQVIAKTGNSGNVAAHLHWDVRKAGTAWNSSINNYYEPKSTITTSTTGGEEMFKTKQEILEAYAVAGRVPSAAEIAGWMGQSKQRFIQLIKAETDAQRKQLADVKKALANLKAKPAKVVIKEVEKIIEVPVEKITIEEVEIIKEVEKPLSWQRVIDWVLSKFNKEK